MLMVGIICTYHSILRVIGKTVALLTAGLVVGFMQGIGDVKDMYKFMAYRMIHAQATRKKQEKEDKKHEQDDDTGEG